MNACESVENSVGESDTESEETDSIGRELSSSAALEVGDGW